MAPLSGIKVVEAGVMIAVPAAAGALAQLGASVIKLEDNRRGDELRNYGSSRGGMSAWFANVNAGKRSIAVDLTDERGQQVLWKLLEEADVFIQGFRPGVMAGFGFDKETIATRCPKLIYCSSTGYGESGPYADLPAYDPVIQSLSGWAGCQQVNGEPTLHKAMVADKTAASFNTQAILAALVQRGNTGKGCFIEASMLESNIMFNWPDVMMHCSLLEEDGNHVPNLFAGYRLYRCKDGFATFACGNDRQWQSFCKALGAGELAKEPKFATAQTRNANIAEFFDAQESVSVSFPVKELVAKLREADVPVAPVHSPEEVAADEQVQARQFVTERSHPLVGRFLAAAPMVSMFGQDVELSPAPTLGEQSAEIMRELGYADAEVSDLATAGVLKGADTAA